MRDLHLRHGSIELGSSFLINRKVSPVMLSPFVELRVNSAKHLVADRDRSYAALRMTRRGKHLAVHRGRSYAALRMTMVALFLVTLLKFQCHSSAIIASLASVVTCILLTGCPHLHGMIYSGRGKQFSVWRPCHRHYVADVAAVGKDVISGDSIPYLHHLIVATCSDKSAIR